MATKRKQASVTVKVFFEVEAEGSEMKAAVLNTKEAILAAIKLPKRVSVEGATVRNIHTPESEE